MKQVILLIALSLTVTSAQATEVQNSTSSSTTGAASSSSTSQPAPAATSTAVLDPEAQATAGKNWTMSFVSQTAMDAASANYQNETSKSFSVLNFVGAGYKLNQNSRVGLRQYFSFTRAGNAGAAKTDTTTMMDSALTYNRSNLGSFLGSDPLAATLLYFAPTSVASSDMRSNGSIRMDTEIVWTLSPKWSVSYFLSPRQSMIPEGSTLSGGEAMPVFSKTSLLHYASVYYSFNDLTTAYSYVGYMHRLKSSNMKLDEQNLVSALGASFTLMNGKIQVIPEVSVESKQVAKGDFQPAEQIIQENNISYNVTGAFVF